MRDSHVQHREWADRPGNVEAKGSRSALRPHQIRTHVADDIAKRLSVPARPSRGVGSHSLLTSFSEIEGEYDPLISKGSCANLGRQQPELQQVVLSRSGRRKVV